MTSIEERLDRNPEPWKPEPGDRLIGEVVELEERSSEHGTYPVVSIATADNREIVFHAFQHVAREQLARLSPSIGDQIGVAYLGRPKGKDYENYRIVVQRPPEQ